MAKRSNVVFDLGGVVYDWEPEKLAEKMFPEREEHLVVIDDFLGHRDWLELDRGTLSAQQAASRGADRTGLDEKSLARFLAEVPSALVPKPGTLDLMRRLEERGFDLYCLSNMHTHTIEQLDLRDSFWDLFIGRVVSCRIHFIKPEPEIYRHLLDRFSLAPEETVFIDDMPINLSAARDQGIHTVEFRTPEQCERDLHGLGWILESGR